MVTSEAEAKARVEQEGGVYQSRLSTRSLQVFWVERRRAWAIIEAIGGGRVTLKYQGECKKCGG